MFTFREMTDDPERLKRRIRRILGSRHAMRVDELPMRLGMDKAAIQTELDAMMAHGEVERLRPIDYPGENHDFFRVNRPVGMTEKSDSRLLSQVAQNGQEHVRLAGEAMACLAD